MGTPVTTPGRTSVQLNDLPVASPSPAGSLVDVGPVDPNFKGVNSAVAATPAVSPPTPGHDGCVAEPLTDSSPAHPSTPASDGTAPSSPTHGHGLHVLDGGIVFHGDDAAPPLTPTHGHGLHVLDGGIGFHGDDAAPPSTPTHGHGLHVLDDSDPSSPTHSHGLHVLEEPSSSLGPGASPATGGEALRRVP
ncbi:hypothetical protein OH76DRAFT_1401530 [Lentinus brumalis]|uniref:Uncharacterized protein n=1 Tax=Lentinus brumalis TaxID=2498619 RepID=A0A371DFB2_9APHY|nr:hypothetical protein OH76DRAFT_1401530 [Polyporus brumalis]